MSRHIQAIRGMHDVLPLQTPRWQHLEAIARDLMRAYSYEEVRMPVLEKTDLFVRTIGEVTDIVEKEMYTFDDRNGGSLTLRPEGTAGCVRAGIENGLLHNQVQRFWYAGPMFRHERPQKGRYRQFHQIGVETFGMAGPDIDAELIIMTARLWHRLGLDGMELQMNSLGNGASRSHYRQALVEYLSDHRNDLDEDSQRRLQSNPLRILDSKNPDMHHLIAAAPAITDYLDNESADHFSGLCELLDGAGIEYVINARLMRGLDYYQKTVFEWLTDRLGAQGTVCAGGRYDGLVEQLGGRATPAAGFAAGIERLLALCAEQDVSSPDSGPDIYIAMAGDHVVPHGLGMAERLRDELPGLAVRMHCGGGSFKNQLKRADKCGARIALLLGDDEIANEQVTIKYMQGQAPQQTIALAELAGTMKKALAGGRDSEYV